MPIFEYRAADSSGKTVNGTLLSGSLSQAAQELERLGYSISHLGPADTAISLSPAAKPEAEAQAPPARAVPPTDPRSKLATEIVGPLINKPTLSALHFFFRQLATMLHAGVPMVQALDTLSGQSSDPRLRGVIRECRDHVSEGRPISAGLQRYPEMFTPLMLSLIRVGEQGGVLEKSCRQLADYLQYEIELRNLVRRLTFYPKLTIFASIFIVLGANAIIASVGRGASISTPLTTPSTWFWLAPLLVGIFLFVRLGMQNPRVRYAWEQFVLGLPYFGTTMRQVAMARFGRAFGALYAGGVPVAETMRLAADACGNELIRSRLYPLSSRLEEGARITDTLRAAGVFSPIVLDMVNTGETTGNVDMMLEKMAEFYEDDAKVRATQSAYAFGVFALVAVGVYVGYIAFNFYSQYAGGLFHTADEIAK